jgi:hypothetical protein
VRYIIFAFIIYIAFRFIFYFLIPVIKTTRQVKKGFREMHSRMQEQYGNTRAGEPPIPKEKKNNDDYIDFEEVK